MQWIRNRGFSKVVHMVQKPIKYMVEYLIQSFFVRIIEC